LGVWLQLDAVRWCVLVLVIAAVLVGETINTAIEALVDLVSPDYHEQAKIAKDVSAGAVLILSVAAVVVGLLLLAPPLLRQLVG
jgi:diacylglycerol kinase